jgi:hypothetical protein
MSSLQHNACREEAGVVYASADVVPSWIEDHVCRKVFSKKATPSIDERAIRHHALVSEMSQSLPFVWRAMSTGHHVRFALTSVQDYNWAKTANVSFEHGVDHLNVGVDVPDAPAVPVAKGEQ